MKQMMDHVSTSLKRMGQISPSKSQKMGSCKGQSFYRKMRKGTTHRPKQSIVPFSRVRGVGTNGWATGPGLSCRETKASIRQESGPKPRRKFPGRSPAPEGTRPCSQVGSI